MQQRDARFPDLDPANGVRSIRAQSDRSHNQCIGLNGDHSISAHLLALPPIHRLCSAGIYFSNLALPALKAEARAPVRPNWVRRPLIRWVEFKFLTTMIWKQVALPWREAITDQARKSSQICKKLSVRGRLWA